MEFNEKVRKLLRRAHLSQKALGAQLGTSQQTVSRWIRENQIPTINFLSRMARILGVTIDYLVYPEIESPEPKELLVDDEKQIINLYRALRITPDEALRRIAGADPHLLSPKGPTYGELKARARREEDEEKNNGTPKAPRKGGS